MKGHRFYAAFYEICSKLSDRQLRPYREFAAGGASGKVVEIGCGTGGNFPYYDWSKTESLDATEPDPFMLRKARSKLRWPQAGLVRLREAPAEELPFPDASFDTAVATLVFCTVDDPAKSLSEIRRVLKLSGSLRLVEHVRAEGRWARFQDVVQPVYGWFSAGCVLGRATEEYLREAGFRVEVVERPKFAAPMPGLVAVAYPA